MLNLVANGPSGYNINNSLRFRSSASAYLSRTPTTPTNGNIWTYSVWFKRGTLGVAQTLLEAWAANNNTQYGAITITSSDTLTVSGWTLAWRTTTQVFRDPSSWYHLVVAVDTTQATGANRVKVYINGSQVTSFGTSNDPTQNTTTGINTAIAHSIGSEYSGTRYQYFDGYNAETNFIDGQALTPSSFGNTNSTTGVWQPAKYTGTYGTNGFYLPFSVNTTSTYAANLVGSTNTSGGTITGTLASAIGTSNFTIEAWINPTSLYDYETWFSVTRGAGGFNVATRSTGTLTFYSSGAAQIDVASSIKAGQWQHIAFVRNGTTLTGYVNGVALGTATVSTNFSTQTFLIGATAVNTECFNGQISNLRLTNTAVYTSNFVPSSVPLTNISGTMLLTCQSSTFIDNSSNSLALSTSGSVTPVTTTARPFTSNVAADASGNGNNWTPNNISLISGTTYDAMTDVPTLTSATVANYCTLNPLSNTSTLTEANLTATNILLAGTTMATPNSGKWYFEYTQTTSIPSGSLWVGVSSNTNAVADNQLQGYSYASDGRKVAYNTYTSGYGATWTTGDVIGCALDLDGQTITFYKNGTSQGTAFTSITAQPYVFALSAGGAASTKGGSINCGQRPFTYSVPSGFVALNTYNLPTPTILQGNKYMDATLYTGTRAAQSVVNAGGFKPDLVWCKLRSGVAETLASDSVRGVTKQLFTPLTVAEQTDSTMITAFNSNGFSLGDNSGGPYGNINYTIGGTYVGWQWQAGQGSSSSNTNGSITSTVSVNASAGFSILTYTGNGSAGSTIGHGLGVAPSMIITKRRSAADNWAVYHKSMGATQDIFLSLTNAAFTSSRCWNNTSPTSSVFTVGSDSSVNTSTITYVAYCWAEIAGFSKFGSYTGNGSTDGPFVYCGFRPKFVLIKNTAAVSNWDLYDTTRSPYNQVILQLFPNTSDAEDNTGAIDILSNGFKFRSTNANWNGNGNSIIYMAFAENPFRNSLAR
jgi:hypothetical protein